MEIPYAEVNIRQLLEKGHALLRSEHKAKENVQRGVLRAGNSGCITDGTVYGECHRISHARALGHDKPVSFDREIMFQGGEANEDQWNRVTVPAWPGLVVRHAEVRKQGSWGTVMGHPDIILADAYANWKVLLELKQVMAANSAIYRCLEGEPDSKHLIQSATYMWMTGVPTILCYTSRSDFALEFKRKQYGGQTKIQPFYRMFYLTIKGDTLWYRDEFEQTEVKTNVTISGIVAYYQLVHDMAHDFSLRDRPSNDSVTGRAAAWDRCDRRYCAFADACNESENNYQRWIDTVKETVQ